MSGAGAASGRYSLVAIGLHWGIAALILTNLALGWRFEQVKGLAKFELLQLHKSIGITILLLSALRLVWRLTHAPPRHTPPLEGWQAPFATATHWLFYGLMLGLPLSGWVMVSASPTNIPTLLFKTVPWPHIGIVHDMAMAQRKLVAGQAEGVHGALVWTACALLALHVGAAIFHQVWERRPLLARMWPLTSRQGGQE